MVSYMNISAKYIISESLFTTVAFKGSWFSLKLNHFLKAYHFVSLTSLDNRIGVLG